jgi:type II secretory pathway component PulF
LELDYLKDQPREEYRPALTMALQNLVDALEASGSESKALAWAVRTCSDDKVRQAFQFLERQVQAGTRLAECQYPNVFMPITANLVAAHDAVGTLTLAYKELARLLSR